MHDTPDGDVEIPDPNASTNDASQRANAMASAPSTPMNGTESKCRADLSPADDTPASQQPSIQRIPNWLTSFAWCDTQYKKLDDHISDLKDLAAPEYWGDGNRILRNYVLYMYQKIADDHNRQGTDALCIGDTYSVFNTGLTTERFEQIYALFEPNPVHKRDPKRQVWKLKGFYKESAPELMHLVTFPQRPRLVEDPNDLIFDTNLPIRVNLDHILGDKDNLERLPDDLKGREDWFIRRLFRGAVEEARIRVSANYTLAVPQYYRGSIQLLLPLCLTEDVPQLALVVKRMESHYTARTCLTLDMAYNNARLLVRPESQWLSPAQP